MDQKIPGAAVKKDIRNKFIKEFNRIIFSLDNIYIVITSVLFAIIYVYLAEPSRVDEMSRLDIALIILTYASAHVFFAWAAFARIVLYLPKSSAHLFVAAALTCVLADAASVLVRYSAFPSNTVTLDETLYVAISISATALLLSMPGWLFFVFRNQHRLVAALRHFGMAVQDQKDLASFQDDLQKLLPISKRGHLLFLRASGNYTEVVTTVGSHMLRIGIGEAERKTTASGLRVHKSYWVARDEILRLIYTSGNPQIVTQSGKTIPVSRSAVPALRAILAEGVAS